VIPAAAAVTTQDYVCILPQLFVQIYYIGTPLSSALVRVWAARKPASYHTDVILFMKSAELGGRTSITKYSYGSAASRPWSIGLPLPGSLCICANQEGVIKWCTIGKPQKTPFGEGSARYRSSCYHVFLKVAVCLTGVTVTHAGGAQVVKQPYDHRRLQFPLDSRDCYHISVYKVSSLFSPQTNY
jgi:hypothetical protein